MSLFKKFNEALFRRNCDRDIQASLEHYRRYSGNKPDVKQAFSDAGTFRSQVDRLFAIGNDSEVEEMKGLADATVTTTLTNRYYRTADYLSDVIDDLERTTYLTGESLGEPALDDDLERWEREQKIKAVTEAWIAPLKVGSIEASLAAYSDAIGRSRPYGEFREFERAVARLFSVIDEMERTLLEGQVRTLVASWVDSPELQSRFPAPASAIVSSLACLNGETMPNGVDGLRCRRRDQPMRLSTLVSEDREHYLVASLARWDANA